jgi:hypothetical protein
MKNSNMQSQVVARLERARTTEMRDLQVLFGGEE